MIREAVAADIPRVMEMGRDFADEAGVTDRVGWNDDAVRGLLEVMIESPDHILLVGDKAILGGLVFPHPFSGRMVFQEMFWRSHGGEGVKMLRMAERMAKDRGCTASLMLAIETMPGAKVLYERLGYEPAEQTFIKEL